MSIQPHDVDALNQQRDREDLAYMRRLLTQRTAALNRVITERDDMRKRVSWIADRLQSIEDNAHLDHRGAGYVLAVNVATELRAALNPKETKA